MRVLQLIPHSPPWLRGSGPSFYLCESLTFMSKLMPPLLFSTCLKQKPHHFSIWVYPQSNHCFFFGFFSTLVLFFSTSSLKYVKLLDKIRNYICYHSLNFFLILYSFLQIQFHIVHSFIWPRVKRKVGCKCLV